MHSKPRGAEKFWVLVVSLSLVIAGLAAWGAVAWWSDQGPWVAPPEAKALANPVSPSAAGLAAAKIIYSDRCARCHGDDGSGDGPDASMYKTKPAALTDPQVTGAQTDGEIFWKIGEGRRPMPGFQKDLTDEQRWQLVNLIRSLPKSAPPSQPVSQPPKPS